MEPNLVGFNGTKREITSVYRFETLVCLGIIACRFLKCSSLTIRVTRKVFILLLADSVDAVAGALHKLRAYCMS